MDMDISKYQIVLHCFLDHNSQHSKGKLLFTGVIIFPAQTMHYFYHTFALLDPTKNG